MKAMYSWKPRNVLIESNTEALSLSAWVDRLESRAAEIRDYLEEQLSQMDWVDGCHNCSYLEGDAVLLRQPERRQKRQAPYEARWVVSLVVAPSMVKIVNRGRSKLVYIELIKMDPSPAQDRVHEDVDDYIPLLEPAVVGHGAEAQTVAEDDHDAEPFLRMTLRDRGALRPPLRCR